MSHAAAGQVGSVRVRSSGLGLGPMHFFAFLLPWIPRPTAGGLSAGLAPAATIVIVLLFVLKLAAVSNLSAKLRRAASAYIVVSILIIVCLLLKVFWYQEPIEFPYLAGRALVVVVTFVCFMWMALTPGCVPRVFRSFLLGYLLLSCLMIVVGITGVGVFEAVRPSRNYGFTFYKTAGVPRSYGELAIMGCIAWSYLLVFRTTMRRSFWLVSMCLVALSFLVGQSRTGLIAWACVTVAFLVLARSSTLVLLRPAYVAICSTAFVAGVALTHFQDTWLVQAVVGQKTLANNVDDRLGQFTLGLETIVHQNLFSALFGYPRAAWAADTQARFGAPVELHNHLLSTVVFFGLAGGLLFLFLMYFVPLWLVAGQTRQIRDGLFLGLGGLGAILSLQFYEGFFSPVVCLLMGGCWASLFASPDEEVPPIRARPVDAGHSRHSGAHV